MSGHSRGAWPRLDDHLEARALLLKTAELQAELLRLQPISEQAHAVMDWAVAGRTRAARVRAGVRLGYWRELRALSTRTDLLYTAPQLDRLAQRWDRLGPLGRCPVDCPLARWRRAAMLADAATMDVRATDDAGRARRLAGSTIALAVDSIRRRVGGMSASEADDATANAAYSASSETVVTYRKRLRDRSPRGPRS